MTNRKSKIRILSLALAGSMAGAAISAAFNSRAIAENGSVAGAYAAAAITDVTGDVFSDASGYFDEKVVTRLPEAVNAEDEISLIISMSVDTVTDVYENNGGDYVYGRFAEESPIAKAAAKRIETEGNKIIKRLDSNGIRYDLGMRYDTLISGFEITVKAKDLEAVENVVGSDAKVIVGEVYEPAEAKVVTNDVDVYATGIFANDGKYTGDGVVVAILDTGLDYTHSAFNEKNFDIRTPAFTLDGADGTISVSERVKSTKAAGFTAGLTGEDVYMNTKIPYAYDYADKDPDVLPINSEHGTHVAGIIAGNDDRVAKVIDGEDVYVKGVAPNAQLAIMKVFSDRSQGAKTSWLIAALEDCVTLGVDVINMSLGSDCGFSREEDKDEINKIYDKVHAMGISLIASAANAYNATFGSGKNGTNPLTSNPDSGTVGSPSTYDGPLSIASVDGVKTPYITFNGRIMYFNEASASSMKKKDFVTEVLATVGGVQSHEFEFVTIPGIGRSSDYPNVNEFYRGKIVLVKRGQTTFEEKVRIALIEKGAAGIIIYNNISGQISMSVGADVGAVCSISQDDGEFLAAAGTGKILISQAQKAGPFMSDFSSWGPTSDLRIKPEITGHGGEILSAVPGQAYDSLSGTSMAAPNVSGATALIRQYVKYTNDVFGDGLTSYEINALVNKLMMSTADIIYNKNGLPYAVRKQGAGLVNITKSYTTSAYISTFAADGSEMDKTKLELGDDKEKTGVYRMTFAINNITDGAVSYGVGSIVQTEGVSETYTGHGDTTSTQDGYLLSGAAEILSVTGGTESGGVVTVPARGSATVTVELTLTDEDKKYIDDNFAHGMYVEGFVTLAAQDKSVVSLNVPFLAFYGDWTEAPLFDEEYYDTNVDELNAGIDDDDKLMPDAYATRVLGGIYSDYISTLGTYYFVQNPSATQIPANKEHISISNQRSQTNYTVNSLKSITAGLLRNAKKVVVSIVEESTGEEVFTATEYNVRKARGLGATSMYGSTVDIDFSALDNKLRNNTRYTVTATAYLDYYEHEQNNVRDVFTFPLFIDFEAPVITDVVYRTEYDATSKKTSYFADLSVYDNHYAMGLSLGQIIPADPASGYLFSMNGFGKYVTPVYSSFNSTSTVTVELTDYIAEIKKSAGIRYVDGVAKYEENNNSFIVSCYDYALNSAVYQLRLPDEFRKIVFDSDEIELSVNETLRIDEVLGFYPENSWFTALDFESSDPDAVAIVNQTILAKEKGASATVKAIGRDKDGNECVATVLVRVSEEDRGYTIPKINDFRLVGYKVNKAYYSVINTEREIGLTGATYEFGKEKNLSMFPSESVTLIEKLDSYFPDRTSLTYESANDEIVVVSASGEVTAVAEGVSTVFVYVYFDGEQQYYTDTVNITVKDPFTTQSIYLNSYRGVGETVDGYPNTVVIPNDRGITTIQSYAFSGYNYVDKDLENGDVIDDEDPYYIKQAALSEGEIKRVIIPAGITVIEESAFENLTALEEVVIEYEDGKDTLIRIGKNAFRGCVNLKKINLGKVKFINEKAFSGCALESVDLGSISAIGNYSFENCPLSRLTLPESSQSLGVGAFYNNAKLSNVTFDAAKIKIGAYAFAKCSSLTSVDVNAAVISPYAFFDCARLDTVYLGRDVSVIGEFAFAGTALERFELSGVNANLRAEQNGAMLTKDNGKELVAVAPKYTGEGGTITTEAETVSTGAFSGSEASYIIANRAVSVGSYAFSGCKNVIAVSLGSVARIGDHAFEDSAITSVPDISGAVSIGYKAFYKTEITSVTIADGCDVGSYAFAGCDKLKNVVLGDDVKVGSYAFYSEIDFNIYDKDSGVSNVLDDRKVDNFIEEEPSTTAEDARFIRDHYIGYTYTDALGNTYEFYRYNFNEGIRSQLVGVTAGKGVRFGAYSFAGNARMTSLVLGEGAEIGDHAFYNDAGLTGVDVSEVTSIGDYAFSGITARDYRYYNNTWSYALAYEYDAEGQVAFANYVYSYFSPKFTTADLTSADKIGVGAFAHNGALTGVTFGSAVTEISDYAFADCSSITSVDLGENVVSVGDHAFYNTGLTDIDLSGVKSIGQYAFAGTRLSSVALAEGASIGDCAFAMCESLALVEGLDSAVTIGAKAFSLTAITSADLASCEVLGDYAFERSAVTEVTFGEKISKIGENPFYGCAISTFGKMSAVEFNGEEIGTELVENYEINDFVKVVGGVLYAKTASGYTLVCYPLLKPDAAFAAEEGTTRISAKAFAGSALKNVTLPSTLRSIGDKAFYNCDGLSTVVFRSYEAPLLEEEYDESYAVVKNAPLTGYTGSGEGLGIVGFYMWNISTSPNNYYFGATFGDYIGHISANMVMVRPANGVNYDTFIFSRYFATTIEGGNAANADTVYTIRLIDSIPDSVRLTDEQLIIRAREAYDKIPTYDQKALVTNYSRLTSAENTITYLKNRDNESSSESSSGESTETNNGANVSVPVKVAVVSGVIVVILACAAIIVILVFRALFKNGDGKNGKDEERSPDGDADENSDGSTDETADENSDETAEEKGDGEGEDL